MVQRVVFVILGFLVISLSGSMIEASLEKTSDLLKQKVAQAKKHQRCPPQKPCVKNRRSHEGFSRSSGKSSESQGKKKGVLQKRLSLQRRNVSSQSMVSKNKGILGKFSNWVEVLAQWEAFRDPQNKTSFADRVAFMERIPDWPLRLVTKKAEGSLREGAPGPVIDRWFAKNPPLTGEGCFYYAQRLAEKAKQSEEKKKVLRRFVKKTWQSVDFEDVVLEERFWKTFRHMLQEEDHRERVSFLLYENKHEPVARMKNFLSGTIRTIIDVRLAFARDFKNVERLYKSLSTQLKKLPEFMHDHIKWLRLQERPDETHHFLKRKIDSHYLSRSIWVDRCNVVRDLIRDKAHGKTIYDCLCSHNIPDGGEFSDGEFLSGFVALHLLKDPRKALGHFDHLYKNVSTSISKTRAAYWAGRASEVLGRQKEATQWYEKAARHPTIFYGQEAQRRLHKKTTIKLSSHISIRPQVRKSFEDRSIVQAIRAMKGTDYARYLPLFLEHLAEGATTRDEQVLVLGLTDQVAPRLSVPIARTMGRKGDVLLKQAYPLYPIPSKHLKKHLKKVGKAFVTSIIRKESGFDPSLESSAGARGLMQILPSTAGYIYRDENLGPTPANIDKLLFDGELNLKLGCLYLEDLMEEFNGSLVLTAAAYNAGRGRVRTWIAQYGDPRKGEIDEVAWTEFIPYPETTNYIHRVIEAYRVYQSMEKGGSQSKT